MATREIRIPYQNVDDTNEDITLAVEVFEENGYATVIVKIRYTSNGSAQSCIVRVEDLLAALAESGKLYDG